MAKVRFTDPEMTKVVRVADPEMVQVTELGARIISQLQQELNEGEPDFSTYDVNEIAADLGIKPNAVKGALARLMELGYVKTCYFGREDGVDAPFTAVYLTEKGWAFRTA